MSEFEQLNSFEETNAFLEVAIYLGWISPYYYHEAHNIAQFLEKPYKWQSEYEFMIKWVRDNIEGTHIFEIINQDKGEEFLGAYEVWINGRGE